MTGATAIPQRSEIRTAFSKAGLTKIDNDILSKCVGLATSLDLTPEQMAECWEAFSLNKNVSELSDHTFQSYRTQLMKDSELQVAPTTTTGAVQTRGVKRQSNTMKDGLNMVTPPAKRAAASQASGQGASSVDSVATNIQSPKRGQTSLNLPKYSERTGVNKVVASCNPTNLPVVVTSESVKTKCVISSNYETNVIEPYRHMFTTLEERAQALDAHLVQLGNEITKRYGISDGENDIAPLEAVNVPRQDKVCCIGRICNEAHEGKLNPTSVVLEGARNTCGGARINVDLSHLQSNKTPYSLFPGQVVAIEGLNVTGRKLVAHRICEGAAHKPVTSSIRELRDFSELQEGAPLKIMSVCGPFTTSDNLAYEPLLDLMNVVLENSPDVVILTGPFVDLRQDTVKKGETRVDMEDGEDMLVSYEAFFANKIAGLIEEVYSSKTDLHTQFVLVPSVDDATAQWVYPQAPFEDRLAQPHVLTIPGGEGVESGSLGLRRIQAGSAETKPRLHCLSNPCTFKINEVVIGVTSTDSLFHISAEETNANLEPGSRLRRIAQHLLQQRSYYPLFPPPASMPTNLDLKEMHKWQMPCQPDLLIVPSKLTSFASVVLDSTVVINPGHLSKGTTGGTYALMDIHPIKRDVLDNAGGDDVQLPHGVSDRVSVEVKRI